jgi:4-amino-4-deoxy-L-arabinose transferase-like glycosyltransferase
VILCLAALLRVWHLGDIPPGLTHDEAGHGHDARTILHGARPLYQTVGYGREPLYDYLTAGMMALAGPTPLALRMTSALLGLITLGVTFAWARRAFDETAALMAVALQAASFWSLAVSRQALRSTLLPALFTGAISFYWQAVMAPATRSGGHTGWRAGMAALLVGGTLYTYIPARGLWVLFPLFAIYLTLVHRRRSARAWRVTGTVVAGGLLLAVPLFLHLRAHPGAEQRLDMLSEPLQALQRGDLSVLLERATGELLGFVLPGRGDGFLAYNIPGRPTFEPLTGALFLAGIGVCVARWRDPACALSLIWLAAGIAPSLITGATASMTRSIAALPVVFLLPALAALSLARRVAVRRGERTGWAILVGFTILVLLTGLRAGRDYFVRWGQSPHVRAAYQHTLTAAARYVDAHPTIEQVGVSTLYPHAPHDPYVFELTLGREGVPQRYFDGRHALVVPQGREAHLIAPASAPLAPYFEDLPGLERHARILLQPDDLDPSFTVYAWSPRETRRALQASTDGQRVQFGAVLALVGYDLRTPRVPPGGEVVLVTLWQAADVTALRPRDVARLDDALVIFTHALDEDGVPVAQADRLDAPVWDWQPGDLVAQVHRFSLPAELTAEELPLAVGVYERGSMARLPAVRDGAPADDHVVLRSLEVVRE